MSIRYNGDGGGNATRLRSVIRDMEYWKALFQRCEFTCKDFRELVPKLNDRNDNGIYCDPPWVEEGKIYQHSFDESDHVALAELLRPFERTRIVVRYGDHPLIRELYVGWKVVEASSRTQQRKTRPEIWLVNQAE